MERRLLAVLGLAACSFSGSASVSLAPAVRMDRWDVQSIALGLRSEQAAICPREPVQLAVFAEADHRKREKHKRLETWQGKRGAIGRMSFTEFVFTIAGGDLDPSTGWFTPKADMLATATSGFTFEARYKREPDVAPARIRVAPRYDCVQWIGGSGVVGASGAWGMPGNAGSSGDMGDEDSAGGSGGNGGDGGNGQPGSDGGVGPNLRAHAILVRTPFHRHLVLVAIDGDARDLVLFEPSRGVQIVARGGAGGEGGGGGIGGAGGSGGAGNPGGRGGNGGSGGAGASGGRGGDGGTIVLVVDAEHPELERAFQLVVDGGAAGAGGYGGAAGAAGSGGSALGEGAQSGSAGEGGNAGNAGLSGSAGNPGSVTIERGDAAAVIGPLPPGIERV